MHYDRLVRDGTADINFGLRLNSGLNFGLSSWAGRIFEFLNAYISQGNAAMHLRSGAIFKSLMVNLLKTYYWVRRWNNFENIDRKVTGKNRVAS